MIVLFDCFDPGRFLSSIGTAGENGIGSFSPENWVIVRGGAVFGICWNGFPPLLRTGMAVPWTMEVMALTMPASLPRNSTTWAWQVGAEEIGETVSKY